MGSMILIINQNTPGSNIKFKNLDLPCDTYLSPEVKKQINFFKMSWFIW